MDYSGDDFYEEIMKEVGELEGSYDEVHHVYGFDRAAADAYLEVVKRTAEEYSERFYGINALRADLRRRFESASKKDVLQLFKLDFPTADVLPYVDEYIASYLEDEAFERAYRKSLKSRDAARAAESSNTLGLTVGMEYEIPSINGLNMFFQDFNMDKIAWRSFEGHSLFENEKLPKTIELQTDVHNGILSMVHEMDRRLELLENDPLSPLMRKDSLVYDDEYYPGIHVHVGTSMDESLKKVYKFCIDYELPLISFLTSNCNKEGYLSRRMVSNKDLFSDVSMRRINGSSTVEYRMFDVVRDPEKLKALSAIAVGIHGYYEDAVMSREITWQDIPDHGDAEERTINVLSGERPVSKKEFVEFLSRVGSGLEKKGISSEKYLESISELYREKVEEVKKLPDLREEAERFLGRLKKLF